MATIERPKVPLKNCIDEIAKDVLGRYNRKPIYDIVQYMGEGLVNLEAWLDDIGLVVSDGKLCVSYDPEASTISDISLPDEIEQKIDGILTDILSDDVRQDIVDGLGWSVNNAGNAVNLANALGLVAVDGKLCVSYGEEDADYVVPSRFETVLGKILTDVDGVTLRSDIITALQIGIDVGLVEVIAKIVDTGLVVVNGKLCIEYIE